MSVNSVDENSIETIDGKTVALYEAKLTNAFEVPDEVARGWANGDAVAFLVLGVVGLPTFGNFDKSGEEAKKTYKIKVIDSRAMSGEKFYKVADDILLLEVDEDEGDDSPNAVVLDMLEFGS